MHGTAERETVVNQLAAQALQFVQAEQNRAEKLILDNIRILNRILGVSLRIDSPLPEILMTIEVKLLNRNRDEAVRWLKARRTGHGYRRDATWEIASALRSVLRSSPSPDVQEALERAFLHDELYRNHLYPATKTIAQLQAMAERSEPFYELANRRREAYLKERENRYSTFAR